MSRKGVPRLSHARSEQPYALGDQDVFLFGTSAATRRAPAAALDDPAAVVRWLHPPRAELETMLPGAAWTTAPESALTPRSAAE